MGWDETYFLSSFGNIKFILCLLLHNGNTILSLNSPPPSFSSTSLLLSSISFGSTLKTQHPIPVSLTCSLISLHPLLPSSSSPPASSFTSHLGNNSFSNARTVSRFLATTTRSSPIHPSIILNPSFWILHGQISGACTSCLTNILTPQWTNRIPVFPPSFSSRIFLAIGEV